MSSLPAGKADARGNLAILMKILKWKNVIHRNNKVSIVQ